MTRIPTNISGHILPRTESSTGIFLNAAIESKPSEWIELAQTRAPKASLEPAAGSRRFEPREVTEVTNLNEQPEPRSTQNIYYRHLETY